MLTFISVVHILIAVFLIFLVLIQDSKGGGLGVMSGGSQSILGTTGAENILAKATRWTGLLFAITCIALTVYNAQGTRSVLDGLNPSALPTAPAVPADAAAPQAPATTSPNPAESTGN